MASGPRFNITLEHGIYATYIGRSLRSFSATFFPTIAVGYSLSFVNVRLLSLELFDISQFFFWPDIQERVFSPLGHIMTRDGPPADETLELYNAGVELLGCLAASSILRMGLFRMPFFSTRASRILLPAGFGVLLIWFFLPLRATYTLCDLVIRKGWIYIEGTYIRLFGRPDISSGKPFYVYNRLENPRYIRLLKIPPRGLFRELRCEIIDKALDDAPAYEAISYTWGDSTKSHQVFLNDSRLLTSANVYRILRDRSSFWRTRWVWIDFVCINQENDEEKASQVMMMKDIYSTASRVIVWLGDGPDAHLIGNLLDEVQLAKSYFEGVVLVENFISKYILHRISHRRRWLAFWNLISHPYFERVWVIQEVAVAGKVDAFYGGRYLDWKMLTTVMETFSGADMMQKLWANQSFEYLYPTDPASMAAMGCPNAAFMNLIQRDFARNVRPSLKSLLMSCQSWKATDEKDKVFAVLALARRSSYGSITVDYKRTVQEVYLETARSLLIQKADTELLHAAGIANPGKVGGLPSWVPDWSCDRETQIYKYVSEGGDYHACGSTRPIIVPSVNSHKLIIHGICIDQIGRIGSDLPGWIDFKGEKTVEAKAALKSRVTFSWYEEARSLSQQCSSDPYRNGQPLSEAFWRTLIGDRTRTEYPAPLIQGEYCRLWEEITRIVLETPPDLLRGVAKEFIAGNNVPPELQQGAEQFEYDLGTWAGTRRFCVSDNGFIGLVPHQSLPGDKICIFLGAQAPFIVRSKPSKNADGGPEVEEYELVGTAYVHGVMNGEMMGPEVNVEPFVLI
jgi:hypothetical protein